MRIVPKRPAPLDIEFVARFRGFPRRDTNRLTSQALFTAGEVQSTLHPEYQPGVFSRWYDAYSIDPDLFTGDRKAEIESKLSSIEDRSTRQRLKGRNIDSLRDKYNIRRERAVTGTIPDAVEIDGGQLLVPDIDLNFDVLETENQTDPRVHFQFPDGYVYNFPRNPLLPPMPVDNRTTSTAVPNFPHRPSPLVTTLRAHLERQALLMAFLIGWSERFSSGRAERVIKEAAAAQVTQALGLIAPTELGGQSGALMQGYTTVIGTAAAVSSGFYTAATLALDGAKAAQEIRDQGMEINSAFRNIVNAGNLRQKLTEFDPTVGDVDSSLRQALIGTEILLQAPPASVPEELDDLRGVLGQEYEALETLATQLGNADVSSSDVRRTKNSLVRHMRALHRTRVETDGLDQEALGPETVGLGSSSTPSPTPTTTPTPSEPAAVPTQEVAKISPNDGEIKPGFSLGADISDDGTIAMIGAVGDGGAVYTFNNQSGNWTQQTKLIPDSVGTQARFGESIALSNNGRTAVIGASTDENPNGSQTGSAYIFQRRNETWEQQAKIVPADRDSSVFFGYSTALSADGTKAIIAAREDYVNGSASGSVYVFQQQGGEWIQQSKLIPDEGLSYAMFGEAVSLNADGTTAVIGSRFDKFYVFQQRSDGWIQQFKYTSNSPVNDDEDLGWSADITPDGKTVIVGAHNEEKTRGNTTGAAFIFRQRSGGWILQGRLFPDDGDSMKRFGRSVRITADGTTAVIGAPLDNEPNGSNAGSAYAFKKRGDNWTQRAKLVPDDGDSGDNFGHDVRLSEHGTTALIGAFQDEDPNGKNAGSAYIFGSE